MLRFPNVAGALGTAVRAVVSALDAPPVKESPATEDQQHDEDDEERVRIHGVSCLTSIVAARVSVGSDCQDPRRAPDRVQQRGLGEEGCLFVSEHVAVD